MPTILGFVVLTAFCALNLILTLAVIRRLGVHSNTLRELRTFGGNGPSDLLVPAGSAVGPFTTTTHDGEPLSNELLAGDTLVGFFSPGCGACEARLPDFVDYARTFGGEGGGVVAVAVGHGDEVVPYVRELSAVARVVTEEADGPVAQAFALQAFPAFCIVDGGGVVRVSGFDLEAFPPAAAPSTT